MKLDLTQCLDAICRWLEGQAGVVYLTTPRSLWLYQAVEGAACAAIYTTLRPYGGSLPWTPVAKIQCQFETIALAAADGAAQAKAIYQAFTDSFGRPLRMASIPQVEGAATFRINAADPRPPALLGVDAAQQRPKWITNVDLDVVTF